MTLDFIGIATYQDLDSVLRRRGHFPLSRGDVSQTLYPGQRMTDVLQAIGQFEYVKHFSPEPVVPYLKRFAKASFRKMARRLLRNGREWVPVADLVQISGESTDDYLAFLERLLILERRNGEVRLTHPIDNLGASLEHYVAQVCIHEFRGSAEWGISLEGLPRAGGDYDVIAWLNPSLMYVECKSGKPSNIDEVQIREMLQRSVELAPDLAVLLVDTHDDLTNLINGRINPIIRETLGIANPDARPILPQPDYPGVSFGFRRIYVANARPSILTQLRRCLQHYYAQVKGAAFYSDQTANFLKIPVRDNGDPPSAISRHPKGRGR